MLRFLPVAVLVPTKLWSEVEGVVDAGALCASEGAGPAVGDSPGKSGDDLRAEVARWRRAAQAEASARNQEAEKRGRLEKEATSGVRCRVWGGALLAHTGSAKVWRRGRFRCWAFAVVR